MKRFFCCLSLAVLAFTGISVSAKTPDLLGGEMINKEYNVSDFTMLTLSVPADVVYEAGRTFLSVEGPEKIVNSLDVKVSNGRLTITTRNKLRNVRKLSVIASSARLDAIDINGACDFTSERGFESKDLKININGAGDVEIDNIYAESISATLNGAGDIELDDIDCAGNLSIRINGAGSADVSGRAGSADFKINGAGSIDAEDLSCNRVNPSINGVGSIKTN